MRILILSLLLLFFTSNTYAKDPSSKSKTKQISRIVTAKASADSIVANSKDPVTFSGSPEKVALDSANVSIIGSEIFLGSVPKFNSMIGSHFGASNKNSDFIYYTVEPEIQKYADSLISKVRAPHAAIVMMNPKTGRIIAISQKSNSIKNVAMHAKFPAASLFKVVTTAAALENSRLQPDSYVNYRGGTYSLDKGNYIPNQKLDREFMSLQEALGKSCNPVFARVALQHLNSHYLKSYAKFFGFNTDLKFDSPLTESTASIPSDNYGLARTAAGFGDVFISPVHAAAMMSAVANGGALPKPILVDQVASSNGKITYHSNPQFVLAGIKSSTAKQLMKMMQSTTLNGTSAKDFNRSGKILGTIPVAAKTGTLRGKNPAGLNRWFIGAAPISNPEVSISVIVINPVVGTDKPSYLAKKVLEKYFQS